MGIECAKGQPRQIDSHYTQKIGDMQAEMRKVRQKLHFDMKIENIRLTNFNQVRLVSYLESQLRQIQVGERILNRLASLRFQRPRNYD